MISKKHFIEVMNQLEELRIKQDNLDFALHDLCGSGFGSFYIADYQDIIIDIRLYYDYMIRVSRPRYFLFDDTCHSDFQAFVRFQLISLTDTDEAYSFNDLVNRIILESED